MHFGYDAEVYMEDYKLSVVVPVYNEENGIEPFLERTEKVVDELGCDYEIIFSLDPSTDRTYEVIKENMKRNHHIKLITMSRRFRQAAATMAGVLNCTGDICVVIDVDLQDPPEVITELVEKWQEGYDVVYAQRIDRQGETRIRKFIDLTAYRVINFLSDVEIPVDTADFRLINRRVIEEIRKMPERESALSIQWQIRISKRNLIIRCINRNMVFWRTCQCSTCCLIWGQRIFSTSETNDETN